MIGGEAAIETREKGKIKGDNMRCRGKEMRNGERLKQMDVSEERKKENTWNIETPLFSSHLILCFSPTPLVCL